MTQFDLTDKVAIITGASRGIGIYIARSLANEGMNLLLRAPRANSIRWPLK